MLDDFNSEETINEYTQYGPMTYDEQPRYRVPLRRRFVIGPYFIYRISLNNVLP